MTNSAAYCRREYLKLMTILQQKSSTPSRLRCEGTLVADLVEAVVVKHGDGEQQVAAEYVSRR